MDTILSYNLCKIFFASLTFFMVLLGLLINLCESHLPVLLTRTFRYGKFASNSPSTLVSKLEVPKSYFRHFYLVSTFVYAPIVLYEVVTVYIQNGEVSVWFNALLNFACGSERTATVPVTRVCIAVSLMTLQILRRFYDTHFVSVFSKNATMNLTHYLVGMAHYPGVLLIMLSEAPKFAKNPNFVNNNFSFDIGMLEITAIILFLWAWYHQHVANRILGNVRKNQKGKVISQNYVKPEGDWFEYLSSPHCVAEIIMYTAITLLLSNNSGWLYVYAWVISNQVETILLSHWWYQKTFEDFPKKRKALIPYVY